ncbi:UPF0182 family membrane protein [Limnochorda pilosa]|uniref:UPF0182 protein LIP_1848 n=1 Tax=Limnochorda pilosa TaxID=1555112 RepID=A0A0K2SKR0_LIMPI|nr:UPF0182 family protein [Limnochorda pilosa]BAS27691.1 hypothetical protein LIP_1848 [Limnochorda pilosa]
MRSLARNTGLVVLVGLVFFGIVLSLSARFLTDWWWFENVGHLPVLLTRLGWEWGVRLGLGLALTLLIYVNLAATRGQVGRALFRYQERLPQGLSFKALGGLFWVASLVLGFLYASGVAPAWETIARYLQAVPTGTVDPAFGKDLAFYLFTMPFFRLIYTSLFGMLVLVLLIVGAIYVLSGALHFHGWRPEMETGAKVHLTLLLVVLVLLKAGDYWLSIYELVYSPRGAAFGAGYTDLVVQANANRLLVALSGLVALGLLINLFRKGTLWIVAGLVGLIGVSLLAGSVAPGLVQQFLVAPNELVRERPYIENHIQMTRLAYDLDGIEERRFDYQPALPEEALARNQSIIQNIRLWDWRPLLQTYQQIQAFRLYYTFPDMNVDRYEVDGTYQQVMLAAREIDPTRLQNPTWINQHLQYTHGYGVVMSPVNRVTARGLPEFLLSDIPPRGALPVDRPEIYYGRQTSDYVVVNTDIEEFDYPRGDQNAWARYEGHGGVRLSNVLVRAAFALRTGDLQLLLSGDIHSDSRLMFDREVGARVRKIAPFLAYDQEPYLVVAAGRLYWIVDAYTTSDRYPYSQPMQGVGNYIRNPVKVVVDAYQGDVTFYLVDPEEPIARTYAGIYPTIFKPLDAMPEALRRHIRVPETYFRIQAQILATYHMQDPVVFYNREDAWSLPQEIYGDRAQAMEPYYLITQLPDSDRPEFILLLPFTPVRRDNMVGWLAVRNDGEHYGKGLLYLFPKDRLTFGPMQVEARIDQNPLISQQLTLWSQRGSRVIRGNLLVIPVENSVLYVEPIFLQAEQSDLPELTRIIVAHGEQVTMQPTLETALADIFGTQAVARTFPEVSPDQAAPETQPLGPPAVADLARQAQDLYQQAQDRLRSGDWTGYGEAIDRLGQVLRQLEEESAAAGPPPQAAPALPSSETAPPAEPPTS